MYRCFRLPVMFVFCTLLSCCWLEQSSVGSQAVASPTTNHSFDVQQLQILGLQATGQIETLPRFKRKSRTAPQLPEFSAPIGNITAVQGRDVRLVCTIEHLGQYQVAWLKEETKTILSIDTNIITTNYRIFLIPDEEERKWVLHIKDVQSSDRGFYQCQVNTVPMRSTSGYLEVVVPPTIIESQSSQVADVTEHANVSIQCKASGHPRASISWRRDDGLPIRLNGKFNHSSDQIGSTTSGNFDNLHQAGISQLDDVKSDKLTLYDVDRTMAAIYVCTASNGIPSQVSKRIPLYVKFPPKVSLNNKYISVSLGDQLEVDCIIEAFPKANSYWSKKPSSGPTSLEQRKGASPASRWYQLMMSNEADINRGALLLPATEVRRHKPSLNRKDPSRRLPTNSTSADGDGGSDDDVLAESTSAKKSDGGYREPSAVPYSHRHNRIQFRQTIEQQRRSELADEGNLRKPIQSNGSSEPINTGQAAVAGSNNINKAYMTVKQTAINSFTYKLRLTVAQMQADDYGQYSCISTNPLGSSEAHVIVTRADKTTVGVQSGDANFRSTEEKDYQHDSLGGDATKQQNRQQTSSLRRSSSGTHVYDENYLQAIKARQSNLSGSGNSHQKLRLRQSLERNGTPSARQFNSPVFIIVLLTSTCAVLLIGLGRSC